MVDKLKLVNHLLQVVGERKVLTLETGHPSVVQAIQALDTYDEEFQGKGWWFNTNHAQTLSPNNLGEILLPAETLSFKVTQARIQYSSVNEKMRYVRRGNRVYDSLKNTFNIGESIVADLVLHIAIEDLPPTAAAYLRHMAAQAYYVDDDGDTQKAMQLSERVTMAYNNLNSEQLQAMAVNALDSPAAQSLNYRIRTSNNPSNPMLPGGRFR